MISITSDRPAARPVDPRPAGAGLRQGAGPGPLRSLYYTILYYNII